MNRRFVRFPLALASVAITVCVAPGFADPTPLRDDIQVRHVVDLERNTFRIAKDPRDNVLYVQVNNGTIARLVVSGAEDFVGETIAQGRLDAAGNYKWSFILPAVDLPSHVPIAAIRDAHEAGAKRMTNPADGIIYAMSTSNGNIIAAPTTAKRRRRTGTPKGHGRCRCRRRSCVCPPMVRGSSFPRTKKH
ncbi:MAG: hypothetical protein VCF24_02900 [Candidatus Latescibacterota bacterium]